MSSDPRPCLNVLKFLFPGNWRFGIPVLFAVFAAPIFALVAILVVRYEQLGATETLIRSTEIQNASIARAMANTHSDSLSYLLAFDIGDAPELIPVAVARSGLEELVRSSLADTNLANLKLYDGNGVTLFSLDRDQLGENISGCECFALAVSGQTVSELIRTDDRHHGQTPAEPVASGSVSSESANPAEPGAASPERPPVHANPNIEGDLLTTMIRIGVLAPDLVASDGVVEIQSDVTELIAAIERTRGEVVLTVGLPLLLLYVLMILLIIIVHAMMLRREKEARVQAEKAAESEAANRAKSEFLSLMSHELRTPLNAIIGFSELIEMNEEKRGNFEIGNYARTIHESGHHMLRQIVSILDMTAIEIGELELEQVAVDLKEVAEAAVKNVQPSFDRSLVTLYVHTDETILPVLGDPGKLQQVFENLLSNAARFTPAGGEVTLEFGLDCEDWVYAEVRDTGVGMTREQIDRARLPFDQSWSGMSREADGAGLGLTIADKVMSQLGGELKIESLKDVGTKVIIRLPACNPANSAASGETYAGAIAAE